jgi:hypothetical protein
VLRCARDDRSNRIVIPCAPQRIRDTALIGTRMTRDPSFLNLALGDGTPMRAFKTALVVGTILVAINQGDVILAGALPVLWKVCLTYCVPYCVATWGAVGAKRHAAQFG